MGRLLFSGVFFMQNYVVIKHDCTGATIIAVAQDEETAQLLAEKYKTPSSTMEIKMFEPGAYYLIPVWTIWLDGDTVLQIDRAPDADRGIYNAADKIYCTSKGKMCIHVVAHTAEEAIQEARYMCKEYLKQKNSPEA